VKKNAKASFLAPGIFCTIALQMRCASDNEHAIRTYNIYLDMRPYSRIVVAMINYLHSAIATSQRMLTPQGVQSTLW